MRGLAATGSGTSLANAQQQSLQCHRTPIAHPRYPTRPRRSVAVGSIMTQSIGDSLAVVKNLKEQMEGLPPLSSRTPSVC